MADVEPGTAIFGFGLATYESLLLVVLVRSRPDLRSLRGLLTDRPARVRLVLTLAFVFLGFAGLGVVPRSWDPVAGVGIVALLLGGILADLLRALRRRRSPRQEEGSSRSTNYEGQLRTLQVTFLPLLLSPLFFLVVLSFIAPWSDGEADPIWIPLFVATYGATSITLVLWSTTRPLDVQSPRTLAGSYVATLWLAIGVAQAAALFGFVSVFITGDLWVYVEGLVFAFPEMLWIAPTRRNIERRERQIEAQGSSLSLWETLNRPSSESGGDKLA